MRNTGAGSVTRNPCTASVVIGAGRNVPSVPITSTLSPGMAQCQPAGSSSAHPSGALHSARNSPPDGSAGSTSSITPGALTSWLSSSARQRAIASIARARRSFSTIDPSSPALETAQISASGRARVVFDSAAQAR